MAELIFRAFEIDPKAFKSELTEFSPEPITGDVTGNDACKHEEEYVGLKRTGFFCAAKIRQLATPSVHYAPCVGAENCDIYEPVIINHHNKLPIVKVKQPIAQNS